MRKLLLLITLVPGLALAQHGGLWHDTQPDKHYGYSGKQDDQQREHERQLRRERERKQPKVNKCPAGSKSLMC